MSNNPFEPPNDTSSINQVRTEEITQAHATYNVVTDTVTGVNVRWSDNRFQAIFVCTSIVLTSILGAILASVNSHWQLPWYGGALIGSFIGLVIGTIGSGIFLMFYRAARHLKGMHD